MSILIEVHAGYGLSIVQEFPTNSFGMLVRPVDGWSEEKQCIRLWLSLEQWWQMRKILPKADDYLMSVEGAAPNLRDHAAADAYAEQVYNFELAKLTPPPAPEPNAQDDTDVPDMPPEAPGTEPVPMTLTDRLRAMPIIGTLNVDTNTFTPAPGYIDPEQLPDMAPPPAPQMKPIIEADEEELPKVADTTNGLDVF